jgi:hypothetical protein
MKKKHLLTLIFISFCFHLKAQETKCCVFVGTYRSGKENCKPTMDYIAFPTSSEEESKEVNRKFRKDYPTYDGAYSYKNGEYVVVIKYKWRNCEHEGVGQIYGKSLDECKKIIDKRIEEGSYNYNYKIVYQWGEDTYLKAKSDYINGILVDFFVHKKTGKVVRLTFHNKKEKLAKVFIIQPSGNHERIFVPPGDISISQVFESGTKIKISFDEYNVFDKQMEQKKDWWDFGIIEKYKGEVRKMVTDPNKKNVILTQDVAFGIRG